MQAASATLALGCVYSVRWNLTRRHAYVTRDARLILSRTRHGWLVIEHVARPGTRGAGRELRRLIAQPLAAAADALGVSVYAYARDERLARRYCEDLPGMRIAGREEGRLLLVRRPQTTT